MSETKLEIREKAISLLPEDERKIYDSFKESGKPGLGPTVSSAFFELYLNGSSCREIHKLNKAFDLGAIIDAKVRYQWDEERDKYTQELQHNAMKRLLQVQSESVQFIADSMAATHKKYGEKLRKYIQTGDESVLDGFDLGSITTYSKAIEALLKVTGQDQKKKVQLEGTLNNNVTVSPTKALSPKAAAAFLKIMEEMEEEETNE